MEKLFYCCRNRIKEYRKYYKLSQDDLSEKICVSQGTISDWENCNSMPNLSNICCLLDEFNCKFEDLFFYEYVGRFHVIDDSGD